MQDDGGGANQEVQQQIQEKFDAPFVPDRKARQDFDKRCKQVLDYFNQEVPALHYEKQENTQANLLLQSIKQIQTEQHNFKLKKKESLAPQNEPINKLGEVADIKETVLTPKDSGDHQIPENIQDEEEDKKEITFIPLHFQKRSKAAFEQAPLKMRIESIAKLTNSSQVFAEQESKAKAVFQYNSTHELEPPEERIRADIFKQLRDAQFDEFNAKSFAESIFQDQLLIENFITPKKNLKLMQSVHLETKHTSSLKKPNQQQIHGSEQQLTGQDFLGVDLFRDLGPLMREKNPQFEKVQKYYLNEISDQTSTEELMILMLSGVCPVEKIQKLNQNVPEMPLSKEYDSSMTKEQPKARYFKQISDSPPTKNQAGISENEEDDSSESMITTDSDFSNPETSENVTETDSLSSFEPQDNKDGLPKMRESVMVSNIMIEIENASLSESSSETQEQKTQKLDRKNSLQKNEQTAKLKQKILQELYFPKKDTVLEDGQVISPDENDIAPLDQNQLDKKGLQAITKVPVVVQQTKEEREQRLKAKSIKVLNHKIQKAEKNLNDIWQEIQNTKDERIQVLAQKAQLQKNNKTNTSVNSNLSNSSILKKISTKLEQNFLQAIQCFVSIFEMNGSLRELGQPQLPQLPLLLQKAATIEAEDINEEAKGQFLFRIVQEIRRTVETQKKQRLLKNQTSQIQQKIKKSMPTLSPSPSPSPEKKGGNNSRGPKKQSISPLKQEDQEELRPMSQGYGVSISYRKTQPNNFKYNSRNKDKPQPAKEEYISIMSQSNTNRARKKPNHFKPKQQKKAPQTLLERDEESWFSNDPQQVEQDVWI